jgi:hypothetical protein
VCRYDWSGEAKRDLAFEGILVHAVKYLQELVAHGLHRYPNSYMNAHERHHITRSRPHDLFRRDRFSQDQSLLDSTHPPLTYRTHSPSPRDSCLTHAIPSAERAARTLPISPSTKHVLQPPTCLPRYSSKQDPSRILPHFSRCSSAQSRVRVTISHTAQRHDHTGTWKWVCPCFQQLCHKAASKRLAHRRPQTSVCAWGDDGVSETQEPDEEAFS